MKNAYLIGIDIGTSGAKIIAADEKGFVAASKTVEYPLYTPRAGWAEQNPADWWQAVCEGCKAVMAKVEGSEILGVSFSGQMHGLVALDSANNVIRPAILWCDSRTDAQVAYLNNTIGKAKLSELTANIAFAGFTAPKVLWIKENEPENFRRIAKIMLPKDYVNYILTGVHACDYSDASGMLLLDVEHKCWSREMLDICGITEKQMPKLFESYDCIGTVDPAVAKKLGIPGTVKVVAGAGDNAAAAVGTGTVGNGGCNISLGTSGTIFISSDKFGVDPNNALHAFAHADGGYHLMGCMLSAASCNKWLCEDILGTSDYSAEQEGITDDKLGRNNVYFMPYLMGERSPINDTNARGTFIGMTMDSSRSDLVQAVLEGVAFAIRDSFEVAKSLGIEIPRSNICGGGAKSKLWQKILANVLNIPLDSVVTEQGPGYGGAMLAMVGCGTYGSVQEASDRLVSIASTVYPDEEIAARYEAKYQKFKTIYPTLRPLFQALKED